MVNVSSFCRYFDLFMTGDLLIYVFNAVLVVIHLLSKCNVRCGSVDKEMI